MEQINDFSFLKKIDFEPVLKNNVLYDNTIYSFDIETVSLFKYPDKGWDVFDYSKHPDYYINLDKAAVPYICQFGINDNVYFFREMRDFERLLKNLSNKKARRIIWIHNLSYEFGFFDFLKKYTIIDLIARDVRKPIKFALKELNLEFRCCYMLTNMPLSLAAKTYTKISKKDGADLGYDREIYSPLFKLSKKQLEYCEYDIKCVYEIISTFKKRYNNNVAKIPYTSTGVVRRDLKKEVSFYYLKDVAKITPSRQIFCALMQAFSGGVCHSNVIHTRQILKNVTSFDETSAYPYFMCTHKFPVGRFVEIKKESIPVYKDNSCLLYMVEFTDLHSRFFNHYIQFSKCENSENVIVDNGRVVSADKITMIITDVDLEIIDHCYDFKKNIIKVFKSKKGYLNKDIIKFILKKYGEKTILKGTKDPYELEIYQKSKEVINGIYGMSVTNPLHGGITYGDDGWSKPELTPVYIDKILAEQKKSISTILPYAVGVWVTAYARYDLFMTITSSYEFDRDVCYYDTDSIKFLGNHSEIFEKANSKKLEFIKNAAQDLNIPLDAYSPKDRSGNKHTLGLFEPDGAYAEFKTLGAKRYAYRDDDGLHLTVSGVNKQAGVNALNGDLKNFDENLIFNYDNCKKLIHYYNDDQHSFTYTDSQGHIYAAHQQHAVILQPTEYTLGLSQKYKDIILSYLSNSIHDERIFKK